MTQYETYVVTPKQHDAILTSWNKAQREYKLVGWPWNNKDNDVYIYLVKHNGTE